MKLFCVGCGPGDPEFLTIKAVNLIKNAEVIFAPTAREGKPSIALSVVKKYLHKSTKTIRFDISNDKRYRIFKKLLENKCERNRQCSKSGKRVIYLTIGDPCNI